MSVSEVERFFDETASQYDQTVANNGWPANSMLREELSGSGAVKRALDIGAGTGLSSKVILETAQPEQLTAIDVSEVMLEKLWQRCGGDSRLTVVKMAAKPFLFETHVSFDLAVAIGTLHLIRESDIVIAGVARVLSGGGRFIFTYNPFISNHATQSKLRSVSRITFYRRPPADIDASLRRAGFEVISNKFFAANKEHVNGFVVARKCA